ncbi:uncharacterized protein LOC113559960 [Rhopalosiphum maidis]|uniref:uncharacterized protein LOC113559960 n=1 Tax=Rhopalosiphum maidis TaxID=43146 RepID=UPI000EFECB53|nr:uncharacterized protein LOC113559960 [Rhopalosiphum maidis]
MLPVRVGGMERMLLMRVLKCQDYILGRLKKENGLQNDYKRLAINSGRKVRDVGQTFGIAESTLRSRLKNQNFGKPKLGRKPTFSFVVEKKLTNHVRKLSKYFYGLTPTELRLLAYGYAVANEHKFCSLTKSAGYDWLELFLKRNPEISLCTPEGTSLNRVSSFNETNVRLFYKNLEETMNKFKLNNKCTRIFNVDKTGITTVQKPSRILGPKGQKQVESMISWKRGKNVTVVCCTNAAGSLIPPMFIYPRVSKLLGRGGPAGSLYECSKNG